MYKYKLRPGYKSSELLIEFCIKSADDKFFDSIYDTLKSLNLIQKTATDLWMNDETVLEIISDYGCFEISVDIWDGVFIMSPDNQDAIIKIDEILSIHKDFTKLEVDFDEYK